MSAASLDVMTLDSPSTAPSSSDVPMSDAPSRPPLPRRKPAKTSPSTPPINEIPPPPRVDNDHPILHLNDPSLPKRRPRAKESPDSMYGYLEQYDSIARTLLPTTSILAKYYTHFLRGWTPEWSAFIIEILQRRIRKIVINVSDS
ncbi:uncharacterized protein ARMOST_21150 [Armillaria ostoyae]|uniref:Uncharacterized protein n=1 Tax=Armillaria ostoyae TaxID=47428 RepID=A0A284S9F2_ARMOS|nr:uncharacterized protein ARMOST_21150 [Armillaria ostoyae]